MRSAALAAAMGKSGERPADEAPISPEIESRIAQARHTLTEGRWSLSRHGSHGEPSGLSVKPVGADPVFDLLGLLWHADPSVRRRAALALAGGNGAGAYSPRYGHFANTLQRRMPGRPGEAPHDFLSRYTHTVHALQVMLAQSAADLRGMSSMHYSFLSGSLYLAVLASCRDAVESARRLRAVCAQAELCRLLWDLTQSSVIRRLNPQDVQALAQGVGRALAALPPDEITALWHGLSHNSRARRHAYLPALSQICDARAVPHLLAALPGQRAEITLTLVNGLGRLGDSRALPALRILTRSRDQAIQSSAQNAITGIERAMKAHPEHTLLRAVHLPDDPALNLLRSVPPLPDEQQAAQLLRPAQTE